MRHNLKGGRVRASVLAAGAVLVTVMMAGCSASAPAPADSESSPAGGTMQDFAFDFIVGPGNTVPLVNLELQGYEAGIYAEHGLVPTFSTGNNGNELVAALIGGSADFAHVVTSSAFAALDQGECLSFLTGNNQPYVALVTQPDTPLEHDGEGFPDNILDLKGKSIGLTSLGGSQEAIMTKLLAEADLKPTDVTFVAVGAPQTAATSFQEGQIDVLFAQPPAEELLGKGNYKIVVPLEDFRDAGVLKVQSLFATTCDYAEEHPDAVRAFCQAQQDVRTWALDPANRDDLVEWMETSLGFDEETAGQAWDTYAEDVWPPSVALTEEVWDDQALWLNGKPVPDYDEFVNQDCQAAIAELG